MAKERVIHIGVDLDTSGMLSGINQMRQMLGNISVDSNLFKDVNKDLDKITKDILEVKSSLKNGIPEKGVTSFLNKIENINKIYSALPDKIKQVQINTQNIRFSNQTIQQLEALDQQIVKLGEDAKKAIGEDLKTSLRNAVPKDVISDATLKTLTEATDKTKAFSDYFDQMADSAEAAKAKVANSIKDIADTIVKNTDANATQKRAAFSQFGTAAMNALQGGAMVNVNAKDMAQKAANVGATKKQYEALKKAIIDYQDALQSSNNVLAQRQVILDIISKAESDATQMATQAANLTVQREQKVVDAIKSEQQIQQQAGQAAEANGKKTADALNQVSEGAQKATTHLQRQDSLLKQLASRATSLIGIGAVFNYITRGIRDAWNSIKELDKEFTAIAVVTDKTTSQLWQSFNTYAQMAQGLGVATKDAVATSALYYQQGLKTADVMTLTAETIKMARIAGMDFKTATDQMTAALRGYNLEMSQANMVNDIFSTLAANAAVDTKELSYALTKTASIAESAGMSIDTTSAFLAKMIETTREAPENIGTAMKSIVARFEELKKNPLALSVDVEGEEVVANKVEAAIALAGVRLRDETTGQFRNLDDVFLELAKSWDNLDRNTQRYIATIAAGSRQQSRFIALMDGYDRTLELVELAQDSEGQSAAQFLKTLDSLDSKINKITNSLESLYQKFVNSDFFGGLLDGLNEFLQEAGKLDAQSLAIFVILGTTIGSNVIQGILNSISQAGPALNQKLQEISNKLRDGTLQVNPNGKLYNRQYQTALANENRKSKVELLNQTLTSQSKNKITYTYNFDTLQAHHEVQKLKIEIDELEEDLKNNNLNIDANEVKNKISELKQEISSIQKGAAYNNFTAKDEFGNDTKVTSNQAHVHLSTQYDKITEEASKKAEEKAKEEAQKSAQNIKASAIDAISSVGPAMVSALSLGITTALATNDPFAAFGASLATFATMTLPRIFTQLATAVAEGTSLLAAAGGPIGIVIHLIGLVASVAIPQIILGVKQLADDLRPETEKLQDEIDKLQDAQKQLQEVSEKSTAEAAVEKTKYKNIQKLTKSYDELINKIGRTSEENEKLNKTIEDLATDFPDLIDHYDEAGNAVLKQRDTWQEIIDLQRESVKMSLAAANADVLQLDATNIQITEDKQIKNRLDTIENLKRDFSVFNNAKFGLEQALSLNGALEYAGKIAAPTESNSYRTTVALNELFGKKFISQTGGGMSRTFNINRAIEDSGLSPEEYLTKLYRDLAQEVDANKRVEIAKAAVIKGIDTNIGNETAEEIANIWLENAQEQLTAYYNDMKMFEDNVNDSNTDKKDVQDAYRKYREDIKNSILSYIESFGSEEISDFSDNNKKIISDQIATENTDKIQAIASTSNVTSDYDDFLEKVLSSSINNSLKVAATNLKKNGKIKDNPLDMAEEDLTKLEEIQQALLQEATIKLGEDTTNALLQIKEALGEDYNTFQLGFENLGIDETQAIINKIPEDLRTGYQNSFDTLVNLINTLPSAFQNIANQFGYSLAKALQDTKVSETAAVNIEKTFSGLKDTKIPKIINEILSVNDWGNIQNLYALGAAYMDAGASAEKATEAVKLLYEQFTNPFTVSLDPGILADKFKSMAESIQDTAKNFKDLNSAIKEVEENGKLSAQTIIDIVAAGNIEYLAFDEATKAVTINTQAVEDNWKAQMQNAEGTIDLDLQRAKTAVAGLEAQREIEKKKLDILENAAKHNGAITAEEYNTLAELDNKYAIDVINGQLNLNYDQLQNDANFFKDLFNNRTEMYNDLVNQAGYYGEQAWDAFLNHSQEVMKKGDYTAISSFTSKWTEAIKDSKIADYAQRMGENIPVYVFDKSTLEQLTQEQRNKLELIDAEIQAWNGNIEKLEKYRNVIKEITGLSLEDYMASTADATEKANKELEDYVSTLERYYNLQKNIETLERKRTKSLNKWKKTGDQKYLEEAINYDQEELKEKYRLAKASEVDNQRVVKDLKKDLTPYFSAEQLELLNPDKNGYINTDAFYKTKEYQALSQDSEKGQKIDKIISDALSQNEQNLANILDYEDFEEEYIERYENLIEEVEEINRKFDRLANINQALESIKTLQEEAKQANEEYYATGGREGINGLQYIKVLAENIQGYGKAISEEQKVQSSYQLQIDSSSLKDYFYQNSADGKYYYNPDKTDLIDNLQSEDFKKQYDALNELITKYNELVDSGKDLKKQQGELAREIRSTAKSMRQSYSDLITRLADDMATLDQKEIDEVKKKYAMIQEEDEKYLNALQKSIDKQRQLRDQAKSYDDLEEQEKRLALLERDTSGANASEIAALKEQIKDARQSLVDTEQDNIINNISEANTTRKEKMDEETTFLQNVMDERTYDMQYYLDKARDIVDAAINGDIGAYQQMLEIMQKAEAEFYRATTEAQAAWLEDTEGNFKQAESWVKVISAGYQTLATETSDKITEMAKTIAEKKTGVSDFSEKIDGVKLSIQALDQNNPFDGVKRALDEAIEKTSTLKEEIDKLNDIEIQIPIVYKAVGEVPDGTGGLSNNLNNLSPNSGKGYVAYKTNANGEEIVTGLFSEENKAKGATHGTGGNYKYVEDMSNYRTGSSLTNEQENSLENYGKTYGTLDWDEQKQVKGKDLGKELNSNGYYGLARNTSEPEVYGPFSSQYSYNPNSLDIDLSHAPDTLYTGKELEEKLLNYYGQFLDDKLIRLIPIKYKEGGLVKYTGPAWVDGTPSTPEAFLSADDTRNFQELAKILQSVLNFDKAPVATAEKDKIQIKSGDTNIEIHIEVDKIDSEESMEELGEIMVEKIRQANPGLINQP